MRLYHTRFDAADEVQRFDYSAVGSQIETTPQGFLRIPAHLTRVGVVTYQDKSGHTIREFRPPEEVRHPDSLATLRSAPVTIGHVAMVNPQNVSNLSVGHTGDTVKSGDVVAGDVIIERQDAVEQVRAKKLEALSPGYVCQIDTTPGEYKGQRYDQIQRRIRYNHVALLPKGAGRQGDEVSLRLDEADLVSVERWDYDDKKPAEPTPGATKGKTMEFDVIVVRLDGQDVELRVPKGTGSMVKGLFEKNENARLDSVKSLSETEDKLAAAQKELEDAKKASSAEVIQQRVDERVAVIEHAKELAPKADFTGKSVSEIRVEALKASGVEASRLDGKDEAYVAGMFEFANPAAKTPVPGVSPAPGKTVKREDGKDEGASAARERMMARNRDMWKGEAK
jgi:hypothetical protein